MLKQFLVRRLEAAVAECLAEGAFQVEAMPPVVLERPRDGKHGDFTTNLALLLARPAGQAPVAIARAIAAHMRPAGPLAAVEVAMPGYLNMRLSDAGLLAAFEEVLAAEPPQGPVSPGAPAPDESLEAYRRREAALVLARLGVEAPTAVGPVMLVKGGKAVHPDSAFTASRLVEAIGAPAARFWLLSRPLDRPVEVDLGLAQRESAENPYFYVWYAHARMAALLRAAAEEGEDPEAMGTALDPSRLDAPEARELLLRLGCVDDDRREAAESRTPHRLVRSAEELATAFYRFAAIAPAFSPDPAVRASRLLLLAGARLALARLLVDGLGLPAPESVDQGLLAPLSDGWEPNAR